MFMPLSIECMPTMHYSRHRTISEKVKKHKSRTILFKAYIIKKETSVKQIITLININI